MPELSLPELLKLHLDKKYRGRHGHSQLTITVIDTAWGGVVVFNRKYGTGRWPKHKFLEFLQTAKEVT